MKITAIIPARCGSKRIPNKNIKLYHGKPLIYWSIKLAQQCDFIDDIIVSTDSDDIRNIAIKFGAYVPYLRPHNISQDLSTDHEFMKYHIDWIQKNNIELPDIIVHLRPTYPNRNLETLNDCLDIFIKNYETYDSLRTVCAIDKPPYKMYNIDHNRLIPLFDTINNIKEPYNCPAQMLPKCYWHNGCIDIIKTNTIINGSMSGQIIYPYIMNKNDVNDIDTEEDWIKSEEKKVNNSI